MTFHIQLKKKQQWVPGHLSPYLHMHVPVSVFTLPLRVCLTLNLYVCVCVCHGVLVLQRHHCSPPCTTELVYKRTNQPRFTASLSVCVCVESVCVCMCEWVRACPCMHLCVRPAQIYNRSPHSSWEIEGNQERMGKERESQTGYCSLSLWPEQAEQASD